MTKKTLITIVLLVILISVLAYVYKSNLPIVDSPEPTTKPSIVTSFYPLYFFTSQIAGDKFEIINLTPAGVEPHEFEPTIQDIQKIHQSKILVLNGTLESWSVDLRNELENDGIIVIITSNEANPDPHNWLDPILVKDQVSKILDGLKRIDPANASFYEINAKNLSKTLDELDREFSDQLNDCKRESIVTSHTSFSYLANRYGFNQLGITGISPEDEPSAKKLSEISKFVHENQIKYIFFEELVNPELSQTIANETGAQTLVLNPIESLSEEDLIAGKDYISIMKENLQNLKIALECETSSS